MLAKTCRCELPFPVFILLDDAIDNRNVLPLLIQISVFTKLNVTKIGMKRQRLFILLFPLPPFFYPYFGYSSIWYKAEYVWYVQLFILLVELEFPKGVVFLSCLCLFSIVFCVCMHMHHLQVFIVIIASGYRQ